MGSSTYQCHPEDLGKQVALAPLEFLLIWGGSENEPLSFFRFFFLIEISSPNIQFYMLTS